MNRRWKIVGVAAMGAGIIYYIYHRHEAAASKALSQDIASGMTNTASPLSETGGNTGAYTAQNGASSVYGTGAVGNGTPSAPNTQPIIKSPEPSPGKKPIIVTRPGQTPPIIGSMPSPKTLIAHNPQTPPIIALPTTYMKG